MRIARITLSLTFAVAGLTALLAVSAGDIHAGGWWPRGGDVAVRTPIATPVKVFKECQEIAPCSGCRLVYKCRSCKYQRVCARGLCEWRDVCAWGPAVKTLPQGARIIKIR